MIVEFKGLTEVVRPCEYNLKTASTCREDQQLRRVSRRLQANVARRMERSLLALCPANQATTAAGTAMTVHEVIPILGFGEERASQQFVEEQQGECPGS